VDEIDVVLAAPRLERTSWAREKFPSLEAHDRRAPSAPRRRFVLEAGDVGARREQAADLGALDSLAAPVREAHGADAAARAFVEVLGDNGHDVARRERMEVELAGDGDLERVPFLRRIVVLGQRVIRTSKDPELSR
jgi:hypothetical protein